jgi:hypothetical protein
VLDPGLNPQYCKTTMLCSIYYGRINKERAESRKIEHQHKKSKVDETRDSNIPMIFRNVIYARRKVEKTS